MKARLPIPKKELERIQEYCDKLIIDAASKCQWLMIIAFNDALGIGRDRILKVFSRYEELVEEYGGLKKDGAADEKLLQRIQQMKLPVNRLYQ